MAITGNDMPQMLKEMTPHSEAKLRPSRRVGSMANMNTPIPCAATTLSDMMPSIVPMPLWQGKPR